MKATPVTSVEAAQDLLDKVRQLVNRGVQPILCFQGYDIGMTVSPEVAKILFQETQRQLNKLKKVRGNVH